MPHSQELSRIELLLRDIHVIILTHVAKSSEMDLLNAMASTPVLGLAAGRIYKVMDLQAHTVSPKLSINHFHSLMARCLYSGNVEAHYVKGIHKYFLNENAVDGMNHLRLSADGSHADGIYLYGIIMMCRGEQAVGRTYLDNLGWRESPIGLDGCWRRVKTSLHGICVERLPVYTAPYQEARASITCHRNRIGLCF